MPDLSNFPLCQINTSVQFSSNSYNLHICLPIAVSPKKYPWKSVLIETEAGSVLTFSYGYLAHELEDIQDLG